MNQARVLALVGDMDGCALWRILLPFSELQRQGYKGIEWGLRDDDRLADYAHLFNAVILPRLAWLPAERLKAARWFDALHRAGIATIYEMDDDLFSDDFESRLTQHRGYTPDKAKERRECIFNTIQSCDGMTVSSQRLATMARQHVDIPIRVVPNYIDLRWFKEIQKKSPRLVDGLTIGWAGGLRPDSDVDAMSQAWGRIAKRYSHVRFIVQGHHAKPIYANVPHERIHMIDWMPIDSYPAGMKNIDIGCCPLTNTQFNRAKTPIKAMEYAASGAPVVASPTIYNQIIDHEKNGYIVETVDEWEQALSMLVESYDLRKEISKALLAKVRKHHSLEQNAWRWVTAWSELVDEYKRTHKRPLILIPEGVNYDRLQ